MQQLLSLLVIPSSRAAIAVSSLQLRVFDTTVDCAHWRALHQSMTISFVHSIAVGFWEQQSRLANAVFECVILPGSSYSLC